MSQGKISWQPVSGDTFALARDPAAAELIGQWAWYEMDPRMKGRKWDESIECTLAAIDALSENFCKEGIAVWLSLFGSFLPDGVLGAAHLLVNTDAGHRFYLPPVESSSTGRGYVETGFNIENRPGSLRKLFEEHPGIPGRILPCGIRVSLIFVPEAEFMEVGRGGRMGVVSLLRGSQLQERERIVLAKAKYLILPNLDFDFCLVGARKERAPEVENLLLKLWPPDALK
jgi:hypothetical protein